MSYCSMEIACSPTLDSHLKGGFPQCRFRSQVCSPPVHGTSKTNCDGTFGWLPIPLKKKHNDVNL